MAIPTARSINSSPGPAGVKTSKPWPDNDAYNLCTASAEQLCGFNGGFPNECVAPPRCDPCRKSGGLSCRLSVPGTFETCRPALKISVHRGRPEVVGRLSNGAFDPTRKWSA